MNFPACRLFYSCRFEVEFSFVAFRGKLLQPLRRIACTVGAFWQGFSAVACLSYWRFSCLPYTRLLSPLRRQRQRWHKRRPSRLNHQPNRSPLSFLRLLSKLKLLPFRQRRSPLRGSPTLIRTRLLV